MRKTAGSQPATPPWAPGEGASRPNLFRGG